MLRETLFAFALLGAAAGSASAREGQSSPMGQEVRSDNGALLGRVGSVERDRRGRIVSAQVEGLEPEDAPAAAPELVAERDMRRQPASYVRSRHQASGIFEPQVSRSR